MKLKEYERERQVNDKIVDIMKSERRRPRVNGKEGERENTDDLVLETLNYRKSNS